MHIQLFALGIIFSLTSFSQTSDTNSKPPGLLITKVDKKINFRDSAYMVFTLFKTEKYKISFKKDSLITTDINLIETFFERHIGLFKKDEVFVIGDPNARYESFSQVKHILKKYEIYKFRIVTEEDTY